MASSIGDAFKSQIPDFDEDADIQAAFRLYHAGGGSSNSPGIETHLTALDTRLDTVETLGIGAKYQSEAPTLNDDNSALPNGYIWVDSDNQATSLPNAGVAIVSATAPTANLTLGLLWIDTANSFKLKFYDNTVTPAQWRPTT